MPAGCEFICKNPNCKHVNSGFVLTAPWPMGKIQLAILSAQVREHPKFKKELIKLKNEGRKLVCITYPNIDKIPTEAYRIQLWSNDAKCIWEYQVDEKIKIDYDNLVDNSEIPKTCPKTGCKLLNFFDVVNSGINCPHCNEKLLQSRWFTNEY